MAWVIDGNAEGFSEYGADILDQVVCRSVIERARDELDKRGALLDERRASGFVRQCHGDLHLRNIVLLDRQPTPFDGIEFNDRISCTDVLYDLAFLLMDLWRRRLPRHANAVWNTYLTATGDLGGVSLFPLFLSCRAAVRAKTSATAARLQQNTERRGVLEGLAREYLAMSDDLLRAPRPCLVAIGGFSGSGKSTLARALAPSVGAVPGALLIRSDEIRKRLCGVSPLERLGPDGYSAEMSERVYATTVEQAAATLRGGHSPIVDAVFARSSDRQTMERIAADMSVPFVGLWLEAPEAMLVTRTEQRRHDASDADANVVRMQHQQGTGPMTWHRIEASSSPELVLKYAVQHLERNVPTVVNTIAHVQTP